MLSSAATITVPPVGTIEGIAGPAHDLTWGRLMLTSRMQNRLKGLPALGRTQLVCVGKIMSRRNAAQESFFVLLR